MDAHLTQSEINALLSSPPMREAAEREALRHAAIVAREDAFAARVARLVRGLRQLAQAIMSYPAKRHAYAELMALTPRELADIGITRQDIPRVLAAPPPAPKVKAPAAPQPLRSGRPQYA